MILTCSLGKLVLSCICLHANGSRESSVLMKSCTATSMTTKRFSSSVSAMSHNVRNAPGLRRRAYADLTAVAVAAGWLKLVKHLKTQA